MLVTLLFIITINKFLVNVFDQNMEKKYLESMSIKAFFYTGTFQVQIISLRKLTNIILELDIYGYNLEIMNLVTKKN